MDVEYMISLFSHVGYFRVFMVLLSHSSSISVRAFCARSLTFSIQDV